MLINIFEMIKSYMGTEQVINIGYFKSTIKGFEIEDEEDEEVIIAQWAIIETKRRRHE